MKKWIGLILAALMVLALAACGKTAEDKTQETTAQTTEETTPINIAVLSGPTGMGMAKLMRENEEGKTKNTYQFTISSDPSDVLAKVISGEYDVAALPTNTAAAAYAKSDKAVQMLAINTYGTLYLLQNTELEPEPLTDLSQLAGKTIVAFGQGANPEYILDYVLTQNGLTVGENVTVSFSATAEEVLTAAAAGTAAFVMLPEPSASVLRSKNDAMITAFDLTKVWDDCAESPLVMGSLVVSAAFAKAHPDAIAAFLDEYAASVDDIKNNPKEAAAWIASYGIVPNESIAAAALENCNLTCITGTAMQETIEGYYQILFDYNPSAVGGAIPDEAFYYTGA